MNTRSQAERASTAHAAHHPRLGMGLQDRAGCGRATGEALSVAAYPLAGWMPATVPGTVLTTLLNNGLVPDPFYGMNNASIPDIYHAGSETYTYWFVKDIRSARPAGEQAGMVAPARCQLRLRYLSEWPPAESAHAYRHVPPAVVQCDGSAVADGNNRLAVIVYPVRYPG